MNYPNLPSTTEVEFAVKLFNVPNQENIVVKRFRRRDDAVAYLQVLKQSARNIAFKIIFKAQNVNMPRQNEALNGSF